MLNLKSYQPYLDDKALAGAVIEIDKLLRCGLIVHYSVESVKKRREKLFNKIYSPHIKYYIKSGKYKID